MIVLNMIVKNEAHCLARCLRSVKPFINQAVIVDTGSTDSTASVIDQELQGLPLTVYSRPWVDFAHNRTEAFQLAKSHGAPSDFALVIDADEEFRPDPGFVWPSMYHADVIGVWNMHAGWRYIRPQLLRLGLDFYWQGAVHEELLCKQEISGARLEKATVHGYFDSARNKDPNKFFKDALMLSSSLSPTTRTLFYAAQSWLDAGYLDAAYAAYDRRSKAGGFEEEVWYSLFMMARLLEEKGADTKAVCAAYNKAYARRRSRAEPLRALAAYLKKTGDTTQAAIVTEMADRIPMTSDQLFVDPSAYVNIAPSSRNRRMRSM